jgi:HPt (histidine-containing phosphotransfer) domain-containing protein
MLADEPAATRQTPNSKPQTPNSSALATGDAGDFPPAERLAFEKELLGAAEALLARVDGDHDLLAELAGLLRELAPDLLADIRDGVAAGEPYKVERAAHQLRGSISSFGATDAAQTANMLEQMGRRGELTGGAQRCAHLERQVRDLIEHLDRAICYVAA